MLRQTYQPPAASASLQQSSDSTDLQTERMNELSHGVVDLSSLYHGWSTRRWTKLHQFINHTQHHQLQLCWVCTATCHSIHIPVQLLKLTSGYIIICTFLSRRKVVLSELAPVTV